MRVMDYLKKLWLRYQIKKDESFLLENGMRKARANNLELNLGAEEVLRVNNFKGRIYLPPAGGGIDARQLIALVADDFPGITRKYLDNKEKLGNF